MKSKNVTILAGLSLLVGAANAATYTLYDPKVALDPLEKGFSISGTITAPEGIFAAADAPIFTEWDITLTVRNDTGPNEVYSFVNANSNWEYSDTPPYRLLEITSSAIFLGGFELLPGAGLVNSLVLTSSDQELVWFMDQADFQLISVPTDPDLPANGVYAGGASNAFPVAFMIPEPSSAALLLLGLSCLSLRVRRRI